MMSPEEAGLLQAIHSDPCSDIPRRVYADWLEEHDSPLAPYIRAECDLIALPPRDRRFGKRLDSLEQIVRSTPMRLGGWEHALTLERLREKMERVRRRDPECKQYGSRVHRYLMKPPLAEAELLGLERRLGFLLPAEYRAFVLRVANGGMGPGYGLEALGPSWADVDRLAEPCPLTNEDAEAVIQQMRSDEPKWPDLPGNPPGMLVLSETGGGGASFLVLSGPQRGKMWATGPEFTAPEVDYGDLTPHGFFSWYESWLGDPPAEPTS